MDPFLSSFHISDLEQFSGIKAHTIRMWERRYGLLKPGRTLTNIRRYDLDELRTILNVAYLSQKGHKISRIAAMSTQQREQLVRTEADAADHAEGLLNTLVLAMLGFDEALFERSCDAFVQANGFRALMEQVLVKLIDRIGVLWQTSSICPAQEHFVSNLVRHRIIASTAALPASQRAERTHILFLPENEIHELGLLYANHVLRAHGERTIYLGQSVPRADLAQVAARLPGQLVLLSNIVVQPSTSELPAYLDALLHDLPEARCSFYLAGAALSSIPSPHARMKLLPDLRSLIAVVDGAAR
jgi:MerR family transcriptional regulator, light-induced transcriptional regulator